jgi:Predicted AAA-ATPase
MMRGSVLLLLLLLLLLCSVVAAFVIDLAVRRCVGERKPASTFPYGASSWASIVEGKKFYIDKTKGIEIMEEHGEFLKVWRPRRSGKSLLCNQLSLYYDVNVSEDEVRSIDAVWGEFVPLLQN